MKQGKRTRALDSRGRPVPGLYVRDGRYIAGWQENDRWRMQTLAASSLTEAKRERQSLLSGLREGRIAQRDGSTVLELFEEWQSSRSLSERTKAHESHLFTRHLSALTSRRVQDIDARDLAKVIKAMRESYSPWTSTAVYRILSGTFSLALRRGIITRSPVAGLSPAEKPRQKNQKMIARLDTATMKKLIDAGSSERWKAAIAIAGLGGLRIGEVRGLRWSDVDLEGDMMSVSRSLLPDGTAKATEPSRSFPSYGACS